MKVFENPTIEVEELRIADILTLSSEGDENVGENDLPVRPIT